MALILLEGKKHKRCTFDRDPVGQHLPDILNKSEKNCILLKDSVTF
jgi:hypothetical protein